MDNRLSVWGLTTQFDGFLFAPVCEDPNGLQLSVLSALARINRDPWKEAARLAAMPKANAEMSLVSSLDLAAANGWDPEQAHVISARLVSLLPQPNVAATVTPDIRKAHARRAIFMMVWLGLAMMISLLSPNHPATTNETNVATTSSAASISTKDSESNGINVGGQ
jgi:hypothetical protein